MGLHNWNTHSSLNSTTFPPSFNPNPIPRPMGSLSLPYTINYLKTASLQPSLISFFFFFFWFIGNQFTFNHKYKATTTTVVLLCDLERVDSEQEKMSFTRRAVKVPPNSASLEEARHRVIDFFKTVCRSIPTIIDIYNLDEVATVSELRSSAAAQIRKNAHITNTKV